MTRRDGPFANNFVPIPISLIQKRNQRLAIVRNEKFSLALEETDSKLGTCLLYTSDAADE